MEWKTITDIILVAALCVLGVFALMALHQWISRKSIKKVDPYLLWMILPVVLMLATWVVFDKFLILNVRPNGSGEPSFPSTHTMFVATIFLLAAIALPKYVKSNKTRIFIDLTMFVLALLTCIGRVVSNMHHLSDVIGAIGFALIFAGLYYYIIHKKGHKNE